jgi:hypothetical protein
MHKTVAYGDGEMALPEFVQRRGERLCYRRAYPQELYGSGRPSLARLKAGAGKVEFGLNVRPS